MGFKDHQWYECFGTMFLMGMSVCLYRKEASRDLIFPEMCLKIKHTWFGSLRACFGHANGVSRRCFQTHAFCSYQTTGSRSIFHNSLRNLSENLQIYQIFPSNFGTCHNVGTILSYSPPQHPPQSDFFFWDSRRAASSFAIAPELQCKASRAAERCYVT